MDPQAFPGLYAVRYEYTRGSATARDTLRPDHIRFLEDLHGRGQLAASGRLEDDASPGALLVISMGSPQEVARLLDGDPFWSAGVIETRDVRRWNVAFGLEGIIK